VKVVFLILPQFQSQHPFGVSGCIPALKSRVLARRFSIKNSFSEKKLIFFNNTAGDAVENAKRLGMLLR
jgi:hypothetical protein